MLSLGVAPRAALGQTPGNQDPPAEPAAQAPAAEPSPLDGVVFGVGLDGYAMWNANDPVGRVNLLRAYDVQSDSFSLNQANVIVERTTDVSKGRRIGLRLDLMFGQATETLQGSAANEPRPQVYRNVFQAYGTYIFPVGKGLQLDFGKFASALGFENNYTKDQINYSRSYFFNFLPFYHFGFRTTYPVNDRLSLTYWLVNGAQQSEDFNGFKSQAAIVTIKPVPSVSWNVNYYTGREGRDLNPALNPGIPAIPTQPGLSTDPVANPDRSRLNIFDTYATWTKGSRAARRRGGLRLALAGRRRVGSSVVKGGAAYAQYRLAPQVQVGARVHVLRRSQRPVQRPGADAAGRDRHRDVAAGRRVHAARRMAERPLRSSVLLRADHQRPACESADGDARPRLLVRLETRRLVDTEIPMLDLLYVVITLAFFLLAVAYVAACERLE